MSLFFICTLYACGDKPVSLSGDAPVEEKDFMAAFKKLNLPLKIADTGIMRITDTTVISYKVFTQFVPDTVLSSLFSKNAVKNVIKPVGKIEKENAIYLIANFTQNKKAVLAAFLFDTKNKYISRIELLKQQNADGYAHNVSITNEPTFIMSREKTNSAGDYAYTRNGYAYSNETKNFIAVLNDTNEDTKRNNTIINPIDSMPAKNKYSGDYAGDKKNFISLRDGTNANSYLFFIHFEKNDGDCTGELKAAMKMTDATHAIFQESGDPCVIDFSFSGKNIIIKEQGNCGNHRGIKCFFDDAYTKKKAAKPVVKNSKP